LFDDSSVCQINRYYNDEHNAGVSQSVSPVGPGAWTPARHAADGAVLVVGRRWQLDNQRAMIVAQPQLVTLARSV